MCGTPEEFGEWASNQALFLSSVFPCEQSMATFPVWSCLAGPGPLPLTSAQSPLGYWCSSVEGQQGEEGHGKGQCGDRGSKNPGGTVKCLEPQGYPESWSMLVVAL